ncbi:MAG: hypothetical protein U1E73_12420 [Planctomycetota bacterium]
MKPLLVAAVLAGPLLCQQVLVVDINGGTPYQQIQTAINAANPGAIIAVNPGVYMPITCTKPVRILGRPGVVIAETYTALAVTISGIPAGTTCMLSQVGLRSPTTPCICEPWITVDQCAGLVILDEIRPDNPSLEPRILMHGVAGLVLRDSFVGPLGITDSEVHLDGVTIGTASTTSGALVSLTNSDLELTDGRIFTYQSAPSFAVDLVNSRARLRVVNGLTLYWNQYQDHFRLDAASRVDYDPATVFPTASGGPTVWPFGNPGPVAAAALPAVRVTPAGPGGSVGVAMRYPVFAGYLCTFLVAPGAPIALPGIDGSLFFDTSFIASIGCFGTGATVVNTSFGIPNHPSMSNLVFAVQGIGLGAGFPATNVDVLRIQ